MIIDRWGTWTRIAWTQKEETCEAGVHCSPVSPQQWPAWDEVMNWFHQEADRREVCVFTLRHTRTHDFTTHPSHREQRRPQVSPSAASPEWQLTQHAALQGSMRMLTGTYSNKTWRGYFHWLPHIQSPSTVHATISVTGKTVTAVGTARADIL